MKDDMSFENIDGIIKSCRDLMRKDKGMNTDAQRIPQLLWMLFLKCFDDFELQKEVLDNQKPTIEKPYRWRDWTSDEKGRRGDELIEFVNNDLFKYLSNLHGEGKEDQRDVIADIFREQKNFMTDGYGMKDMIQQINKLDFTSSEQFHLIGTVYEKMLLSMRDDSPGTFGEFYTPRPVIKFMVDMINPSLKEKETILDPACGTAGFLIESFKHLEKKVKGTQDNEFLQKNCLSGIEPRPEPYLFSMMNMMLHGLEEPNIARVNTLETKLSDIKEELQHNIIMTNPPFGGEEQDSIKKKLPAGFQTKDTALGFLLHCMSRLTEDGRCAIILPKGELLSGLGVFFRVREKFLQECKVHTIIKLHESVFKPYAGIPTNILFFEKNGPTNDIWYYEMELPKGMKAYNKTNPIKYEDFTEVIKWFNNKKENSNAWKINKQQLVDLDLDVENIKKKKIIHQHTPHEFIDKIINDESKILDELKAVKKIIEKEISDG
jgi:type I restriction enzyme M protein